MRLHSLYAATQQAPSKPSLTPARQPWLVTDFCGAVFCEALPWKGSSSQTTSSSAPSTHLLESPLVLVLFSLGSRIMHALDLPEWFPGVALAYLPQQHRAHLRAKLGDMA